MVNRSREVAVGEAQDLTHAAAFTDHRVVVREGDLPDTAGSDIVIVCVSVPWGPPYQTRGDMAHANAGLFRQYIPLLAAASPDAVLLVVTNPVDALTHLAAATVRLSPPLVSSAPARCSTAPLPGGAVPGGFTFTRTTSVPTSWGSTAIVSFPR